MYSSMRSISLFVSCMPLRTAALSLSIGIRVPCANHENFIRLDAMANSSALDGDSNCRGFQPLLAPGSKDHRVRVWPIARYNIVVCFENMN